MYRLVPQKGWLASFIRPTTEATGIRPPCLSSLPPSLLSLRMEVPLLMPEFLDKALQSKACTNPRMQALRGRRGRPLTWTSSVSRQTETMCSRVTCLALITHWISEKAGLLVIRLAIAPSVAVSSPIQLEAARYSLAMQQECSFPPTVGRLGFLLIKDFRNVPSLMSSLRAPTIIICLPALSVKASGASCWEREHRHLHQLQLEHRPQQQLQPQPQLEHRHQLQL